MKITSGHTPRKTRKNPVFLFLFCHIEMSYKHLIHIDIYIFLNSTQNFTLIRVEIKIYMIKYKSSFMFCISLFFLPA